MKEEEEKEEKEEEYERGRNPFQIKDGKVNWRPGRMMQLDRISLIIPGSNVDLRRKENRKKSSRRKLFVNSIANRKRGREEKEENVVPIQSFSVQS